MSQIIVLAHNIRSTHNVGSLFRTAEGFGVQKIIFSGYSPYPTINNDHRLPHIHEKLTAQIHKTALGAERLVPFEYTEEPPIALLASRGYRIVALEQSPKSKKIQNYVAPESVALLIGEEVNGVVPELLSLCDDIIEIDMVGTKESFNVSVAVGIALYALTTSEQQRPHQES